MEVETSRCLLKCFQPAYEHMTAVPPDELARTARDFYNVNDQIPFRSSDTLQSSKSRCRLRNSNFEMSLFIIDLSIVNPCSPRWISIALESIGRTRPFVAGRENSRRVVRNSEDMAEILTISSPRIKVHDLWNAVCLSTIIVLNVLYLLDADFSLVFTNEGLDPNTASEKFSLLFHFFACYLALDTLYLSVVPYCVPSEQRDP
jgi:hypothetical protein